jgi:hypothetical protein
MKTQGSMFVNNIMANKSMGLTKDCSSFAQGRGDSFQNHKSSSSYFAGSFLPWHWSVFTFSHAVLHAYFFYVFYSLLDSIMLSS